MKNILFVLLLLFGNYAIASEFTPNEDHHADVTIFICQGNEQGGFSCTPKDSTEFECGVPEEEEHQSMPASSPEPYQREERVWL